MVRTLSRVSFSDLKIYTSFLCVLSASVNDIIVSFRLFNFPLRCAVLSAPLRVLCPSNPPLGLDDSPRFPNLLLSPIVLTIILLPPVEYPV